jgi:hypothetical protein
MQDGRDLLVFIVHLVRRSYELDFFLNRYEEDGLPFPL